MYNFGNMGYMRLSVGCLCVVLVLAFFVAVFQTHLITHLCHISYATPLSNCTVLAMGDGHSNHFCYSLSELLLFSQRNKYQFLYAFRESIF